MLSLVAPLWRISVGLLRVSLVVGIGGLTLVSLLAPARSGFGENAKMQSVENLIAHWPLTGDARDAVGHNHGTARNVVYDAGPGGTGQSAAFFNGRDSVIEVAHAAALDLGRQDFSIAVWVRCEKPMRGVFGDILSKFDAQQRRGINFSVAGSAPSYNAMSDARHVHFGIDDGYLGAWEDCGRPWKSNSLVPCLIVYEGELYCGIADADRPEDAARVFRWAGGKEWVDCGRLGKDPNHLSVQSMIVHEGKLYAGTGIWDWNRATGRVQGMPRAAPTRVFVFEGGTNWRDLGQLGNGARVLCMGSFGGELYAGVDAIGGGKCFKYDGSKWADCGAPDGRNLECLLPVGGALYASTHGNVYRYEGGQAWTRIGLCPHQITQIHTMKSVAGRLWIGTWPQGYALRHEGGDAWAIVGRLGLPAGERECNEINDLAVYNGKVYAGVIPKAQVYRYESDGQWTLLRSLAKRPDWHADRSPSWCRVTSLTSFRGRLFASTGSCQGRAVDVDPDETLGRVYALQAGQVVSHERDIGGDWTHLAVVRQGAELRLYVNGRPSISSQAPEGRAFDLANTQPMRIGFGAQGSFAGALADLRLYAGALAPDQIKELCAARGR